MFSFSDLTKFSHKDFKLESRTITLGSLPDQYLSVRKRKFSRLKVGMTIVRSFKLLTR